jgi:iron complex transport system permease protein
MPFRALVLPLAILLTVAVLSLLFSLMHGSTPIPLAHFWQPDDPIHEAIIRELRLPRAASAFVTGGSLALAGALMQVLLRNPLADPYVLGVSGGAASGALLALLLGTPVILVHGLAFGGALLSIGLVFVLAQGRGGWNTTRLLLTGVVLAAGWGAVIGLLLNLGSDERLRGMLFWLMGDLGGARMPLWSSLVLACGLLACLPLGRALNLLATGEQQAAALGVSVAPVRIQLYLVSSLLAASAVTTAGTIGFIGLIAPHMLRLAGLRDHRVLLPAALLFGGSLLVLADTLARTLIAPAQLPVGVLTALIGVPLFLALLYRERGLYVRHDP